MINRSSLLFIGLAAVAVALGWLFGGTGTVIGAAREAFESTLQVAPELVLGLLIAAFSSALISRERIARWLGAETGFRGIALASTIGALMPGGPFGSFPLVFALYKAGADIGAVTAFLVAWATVGVNRLFVWEIPFMGVEFGMLRFFSSLPLPLLAGLAAQFLARRHAFFRMPRDSD